MSNYKIGGTNSERTIEFDSGSWTFVNDGSSVTHTGWGGVEFATNTSDASSIPSETGTKRKTAFYIATAAYNKTPTDGMAYNNSFNCLTGWSTSTFMRWAYSSAKGGTQDEIHQDDPQCWVWYNGAYVDLSTTNPGNLFESGDHGYFSYSETSSGSGDDIVWTGAIRTRLRTSTIPQGFMTDWSVSGIGSCKSILQFVVSAPKTSEDEKTYPTSSQVLGTYTAVSSGSEQDVADLVESSSTSLLVPQSQSKFVNFPALLPPATNLPWLGAVATSSTYQKTLSPYYKGLSVDPSIAEGIPLRGTLLGGWDATPGGLICIYFEGSTLAPKYVTLAQGSMQEALSAKTYTSYLSTHGEYYRFLLVQLTAGGGAGGRSGRVTNIEGSGGGGGGGGSGVTAVVRLYEGQCLLLEVGLGGVANSSNADGYESRICIADSSGAICGVVCDGGRAGGGADGASRGQGGDGGVPYWAASDGYSLGSSITTSYYKAPTTDTAPTKVNDTSIPRIYIIAAAKGGAGGYGGVDAGLPSNNSNGHDGYATNVSSVTSVTMRKTNGSNWLLTSLYTIGKNGSGSNSPYEGGGGGVAPFARNTSKGGNGGRGGQSNEQRNAGAGQYGGGGGGGFYYKSSNYNGGNGGAGTCRIWY